MYVNLTNVNLFILKAFKLSFADKGNALEYLV